MQNVGQQPEFLKYTTNFPPHLLSFIATFVVIFGISLYYYFSVRKLSDSELPNGIAFLIYLYIK